MARSPFRNVLIIKRSEILDSRPVIETIEAQRKALGITIAALCKSAGVSRTAYYKWIEGRGMMPETEHALADALARAQREAKRRKE